MNNLQVYLLISSFLFSLGIYAVVSRQNAVAILMGIELILNYANINYLFVSSHMKLSPRPSPGSGFVTHFVPHS